MNLIKDALNTELTSRGKKTVASFSAFQKKSFFAIHQNVGGGVSFDSDEKLRWKMTKNLGLHEKIDLVAAKTLETLITIKLP